MKTEGDLLSFKWSCGGLKVPDGGSVTKQEATISQLTQNWFRKTRFKTVNFLLYFVNLILYKSTFNELEDVVIVEADGLGPLLLLAARQVALTLGLVENLLHLFWAELLILHQMIHHEFPGVENVLPSWVLEVFNTVDVLLLPAWQVRVCLLLDVSVAHVVRQKDKKTNQPTTKQLRTYD